MQFQEPQYSLVQVQCLYMDGRTEFTGKPAMPMTLQFAQAFAEKHLAKCGEKPPKNFVDMYLKILLERKEFEKALALMTGPA